MTCRTRHLCLWISYAVSWAISIGLIVLGYRLGANPSCPSSKSYMCYNNQSGKLICCDKSQNCLPIAINCVNGATDSGIYVLVLGLLILIIVALIGFCYLRNRYCTNLDEYHSTR